MAIALVLILVAVGSVLFHVLSPWWWTPIASNWSYIDDTIIITFWITGFVFVAVVSVHGLLRLFASGIGQGRRQPTSPKTRSSNGGSPMATAIGVAAMLAPGPLRLEPVRHRPGRRDRGRSRRPAMAVELPAARAKTASSARPRRATSAAIIRWASTRTIPTRKDDLIIEGGESAPAARQAGEDAAALGRCPARFLRAGVPGEDGHGAGHGDLFLVHPDADRHLRSPLRRALRRRPFAMRGNVVVEQRGRLSGLAASSSRPSKASCGKRRAARPQSSGKSLRTKA